VFLTVFLSLYSALHLYSWIKMRQALQIGIGASLLSLLFPAAMIFAPVVVRLLENAGHHGAARLLAYLGYTWMGLLFLFVSLSVVIDFYRLLLFLLQWVFDTRLAVITPTQRASFFFSLVLVSAIGIYGAVEAWRIRTETLTIESAKIPRSAGRVKIAQISDVHLGLIVGRSRLDRILSEVRAADPDILISTGDLVDGQADEIATLAAMIREIPARYGKFAVTGNHEYYAGISRSVAFTEAAGFRLLRGEWADIGGILGIAGIDDIAGAGGSETGISEGDLLSSLPPDRFILFLKHRPLLDPNAVGLFDLQVSGHTHKGQIFPFSLVTRSLYPIHAGLLKLDRGSLLYASRGSGTWGPPIRFLSRPEVTVIELIPK